MPRRFPQPWTAELIHGGYVVKDATGQSLAYVYARETKAQVDTAKVLTMDEARRIASNIAKLPDPLVLQFSLEPNSPSARPRGRLALMPIPNQRGVSSD